MSFALINNRKPSKGDRLKWPSTSGNQPVHFDKSGKPVKLTERELALIRQSKGQPLVP
jgi:hypothetical protein